MNEKLGVIVFVTIGVPFSKIPIMQKVMLYIDGNDSPVSVARQLRRDVADNIDIHGWIGEKNFSPEELYYEVFVSVDDTVPFTRSDNAPKEKR